MPTQITIITYWHDPPALDTLADDIEEEFGCTVIEVEEEEV